MLRLPDPPDPQILRPEPAAQVHTVVLPGTRASVPPPSQQPVRGGPKLGRYEVLSRLGRGGMGTVYLGAEPDGRRVAVKVVNRELAGEPASTP